MWPLRFLFGALITQYGIKLEIWIWSGATSDSPVSPQDGTSHHHYSAALGNLQDVIQNITYSIVEYC